MPPRMLTCGRCGDREERPVVNGVETDPSAWSCVTVSGIPVRNVVLCGSCTDDVLAVINSPLSEITSGRHAAVGS